MDCSHVGNKAFPRWECASRLEVVDKRRLSINKEALLQNKGLLLQHKGALLLQRKIMWWRVGGKLVETWWKHSGKLVETIIKITCLK